jgi:rhodanese-related sulfurtransferase
LLLAACAKHYPGITKLTAVEAMSLATKGEATIVDVREAAEVEAGIAAPARWLPTSRMDGGDPGWRQLLETPKGQQLVFYCEAGGRAQRAADQWKAKGFQTAWFSGFDEWKGSGLPIKKP